MEKQKVQSKAVRETADWYIAIEAAIEGEGEARYEGDKVGAGRWQRLVKKAQSSFKEFYRKLTADEVREYDAWTRGEIEL